MRRQFCSLYPLKVCEAGSNRYDSPQFLDEVSVRKYRVLKTLRQIPSKLVDPPRISEPQL